MHAKWEVEIMIIKGMTSFFCSVSDPFHFDMDPDPDPRIRFVK